MSNALALELLGGFAAASAALWYAGQRRTLPAPATTPSAASTAGHAAPASLLSALGARLAAYLQAPGLLASIGLLLLRLSVGVMMIHHGQEKLADPQQFADTYVASLHLPFPLFFAIAAGLSELVGSWLLIFGLLTPLGALMLSGTMAVAAYQHILTAGFNIYVLELVVLYLGASLALVCNGPGRFALDALLLRLFRPASGAAAAVDPRMEPFEDPRLQPLYVLDDSGRPRA